MAKHHESEILAAFAEQHARCWLCGTRRENTWPPRLEIHHMVRGANRQAAREEVCVLIRTCQRCHQELLEGMGIVDQLAIKLLRDPEHYDRPKVNELRRRAPDAVTDEEVLKAAELLEATATQEGYFFPRWKFGRDTKPSNR